MQDLIQIKAVVEASYNGIDISTQTRRVPFPDAVKIYSYIAFKKTKLSRETIGAFINRAHSTISVAIQVCRTLMEVEKDFKDRVEFCMVKCATILNESTVTFKERIDTVFPNLTHSQQEELYLKATEMYTKNNKEIIYV